MSNNNYKTCILFGNLRTQFPRLVDYILQNIKSCPSPIFIQSGHNSNLFSNHFNYDNEPFIDKERLEVIIKNSDLIITHGGYGSIKSALINNKRPIVVPRLKRYNEHIDNHQLELINYYSTLNLIDIVNNLDDFTNLLGKKNFSNHLHNNNIIELYDNHNLKSSLNLDINYFLK